MATHRISHESLLLNRIRSDLSTYPDLVLSVGQGLKNRIEIPGWALSAGQQFQFGDLRIESPFATVIVEAESGGGVGNLVKYWPYLTYADRSKCLDLVHIFRIGSEGDYLSHRRLWEFLVDRMSSDLEAVRGLKRPEHWDAVLLTYRSDADVEHLTTELLRRLHGRRK